MFSTSAMEKTIPFVLVSYHPEGFMSTLKAGVKIALFLYREKNGGSLQQLYAHHKCSYCLIDPASGSLFFVYSTRRLKVTFRQGKI